MENSLGEVNETKTLDSMDKSPRKWFVPALVFMVFALNIANLTLALLTREIGATFFGSNTQATVGITSQLNTIGFSAAVATGIAMGILAIRFGHKSLLMAGILLQIISAAGAFLAPTFLWLLSFFALEGVGSVLSGVAFVTLVGDNLSQNRKAKAVSYIAAALSLATLAGTRLIPIAAGLGTWRYSYLLLGLPFAITALAVSHFGIPSISHEHKPEVSRKQYLRSFKQVFSNKSAAACLLANLFFTGAIGIFALNFLRQQFWSELPLPLQVQYASYVAMVSTLLSVAGSLAAGRLANRYGLKALTVLGALGDGIFILLLFFAPNLWLALAFNWLHVWSFTIAGTALSCLALDQVPRVRGTMMSMKSVFGNIGNALAPAIGGALLIWGSYPSLGLVLGAMSMIASAIILFRANDTTRGLQE
ncbi:MAG TPA: MFS transporter [Candidatus Sulfotelmatobacter sp.]|nr:MFS transporter [Candidatus Sulfotelmatobacter sp.]